MRAIKRYENGGATDDKHPLSGYRVKVIQYPYGYGGGKNVQEMMSGHIEAVLIDGDGNYVNTLPDSAGEFAGMTGRVNRWVDDGNREVRYNPDEDWQEGVRTVTLNLPPEQLEQFVITAQEFKPGEWSEVGPEVNKKILEDVPDDVVRAAEMGNATMSELGDLIETGNNNLALAAAIADQLYPQWRDERLPTGSGGEGGAYDFIESNCADGVCMALGMNADDEDILTLGVTDPTYLFDEILDSPYATSATGIDDRVGLYSHLWDEYAVPWLGEKVDEYIVDPLNEALAMPGEALDAVDKFERDFNSLDDNQLEQLFSYGGWNYKYGGRIKPIKKRKTYRHARR